MKIIVQKFGGTSVATAEARHKAMEKIIRAKNEGFAPVVVVSAMGRKGQPYATDTLIDLVKSIDKEIEPRELDLLISCGEIISSVVLAHSLKAKGYPAVALTGAQAGILTDDNHGNAQIVNIDPTPIKKYVEEGKIVVVAGFQGCSSNGDVTTLGRGGSDTTATALGAAIKAEFVEIYTDVDGVMTVDPRLEPEANILKDITYKEICEMAYQGAKVIHPRAVEAAMSGHVPIKIKNTFSDAEGTLITDRAAARVITGLAHIADLSQIKVVLNEEAIQMAKVKVFKLMAEAKISLDLINVGSDSLHFVVSSEQAQKALNILQDAGFDARVRAGCAKVSIIGAGMEGVPGVMAKVMESLDKAGINVLQTSDSDITISCLVKEEDMADAIKVLHNAFGLNQQSDREENSEQIL